VMGRLTVATDGLRAMERKITMRSYITPRESDWLNGPAVLMGLISEPTLPLMMGLVWPRLLLWIRSGLCKLDKALSITTELEPFFLIISFLFYYMVLLKRNKFVF